MYYFEARCEIETEINERKPLKIKSFGFEFCISASLTKHSSYNCS